jgi:hypothetical protein
MVERKDVHAALEARRELGPAYDDELVDQLLAKLEERRPAERPPAHLDLRLPIWSMGFGIAATAIASGNHVAWLAAVAWVAIAVVNIVYIATGTRR